MIAPVHRRFCGVLPSVLVLVLCLCSSATARLVNITFVGNCADPGEHAPVAYLTSVDYHLAEDGTCDKVHMGVQFDTIDESELKLTMDLFKCEAVGMASPCLDNPTQHEEILDCDRLKNDESGPWHLFTAEMDEEYTCGRKIGSLMLEFARLRLEHLMKYLDVYDATYSTFRLRMAFHSSGTQRLRGCAEVDFVLLALQ